MKIGRYLLIVLLICIGFAFATADAQENLAQEVSAIFEQSCLICHGPHGSFTEQLIIQSSQELIDTGKIIPENPDSSIFYQRLIETAVEKRMPLGQPPLPPAAIQTIRQWIQAGAPDWNTAARTDINFITTQEMLQTIENHVQSLDTFDRAFARYFTSTHLYNAGETTETLRAYQRALSKLVNSLSWGRGVIKPQPIDSQATIFYIDLRDYEWEIGTNRWTLIETEYPYNVAFDTPTQTVLREKLTNLRAEMNCETPFVHVDWFLATASLPPLYHDILDLPLTDSELEARLEVNVVENIRNAAGKRVWRAGFNNSGVSNHNRIVERHLSRYGAYWKSYDFAGSVDSQNIFTHPLNFTHDGGEIIFNLPNGLQAYYLVDAGGNRLDEAPISIVRNLAVSDPTVRNGLSCIGCHTEGMKTFEDQVRGVAEQNENPPFDKDQVLRLYVEKSEMDGLIKEDTELYRRALEATGDVFGGIEPVQQFHEAFQRPLGAAYAAAAVGLETGVFLGKIRENVSLQNLGLQVLENGTMKRDAWTSNFDDVISALNTPDSPLPPVVERPERIPGASVYIPDPNLRAAIAEALGKGDTTFVSITAEEMATLERIRAVNKNISDLTGLAFAKNLTELYLYGNPLSDISPLASLTKLRVIDAPHTKISDLSPLASLHNLEEISVRHAPISSLAPLANLKNLKKLDTTHSDISDLSPLAGLTNLTRLLLYDCKATDLSPLKGLTKLRWLGFQHTDNISDFSPLSGLTELRHLDLFNTEISDLSPLARLVNLETLILVENRIVDVSPLASLRNLKKLELHVNNISDFSPLNQIRGSIEVFTWYSNPGFPQGGPKIEGPWLWLPLPVEVDETGHPMDHLAEASNGQLTEQQVATQGATEGTVVGEGIWSVGTLEPYKANDRRSNVSNLKRLLDAQGAIEFSDAGNFVVYGSITLYSPRTQHTKIFIGASEPRKVYLNSKLVHEDYTEYTIEAWAHDYQTFFPITLQPGKNVLLIKLGDEWDNDLLSLFFGFEPGTEYKVSNPRVGYTLSETAIHVGDTFTLEVNAENVFDLAGWQFDVVFDPAV
ncbi:hypothetical protein F4X90_06655, partial [Candidatus Poribacteria bacterium]|nr:hypothetical protein [Candidatus Poribacteria bacterium]